MIFLLLNGMLKNIKNEPKTQLILWLFSEVLKTKVTSFFFRVIWTYLSQDLLFIAASFVEISVTYALLLL